MRRPLTVGAVSMCLLLAACAGDDDQATPTERADTVTVVVTETVATTTDELQVEAGIGDTLTLISPGGAQISATVRGVLDPAPFEQPFAPPEGTRLVAVELRIVNSGDQDYMDTPGSGAAILTADGTAFGTGITPTTRCEDLGSPVLRPGERVVGCLTFDIPKGTKARYFTLTSNAGFTPEAERGIWQLGE